MNMTRMIMLIVIIVIAGNVSAFKSDGPFRGDTSRALTTADNPYNNGFKHERPLTIQDFLDTDGKGRSQNNTQALLLPTDFKDSLLKKINAILMKKELEIRIERVETDFLGNTHVCLQQYYSQVPVVGSEMLVHINKKNTIYAVSGKIAPLLTVSNSRHLLGEKAQEIVLANFAPIKPAVKDTPSLVIFNGKFAYKLIFTGTGDEPSLWHCYIDAQTGQELFRLNTLFKGPPGSVGSHVPVSGTRLTKEDGTSVTIQGWHDTLGNYFLYHKNVKWGVYNIRNSDWEQRATNSWGTSDPAAISLAKNFEIVQNWVTTVLHRNSFNNAGAFAQANVHEGTNYVNAYWDGTDFHFGDGDGSTAAPLTVLDVAAHEYGHAITQYTSNLVYSYESGALNESYSDIMGTFVEFATQPDGRSYYPSSRPGMADWLCGEDCWLSADALRDLRNPQRYTQPSYYLGTNWYTGSGDNGGVHYNSGVQNFAFYLLSEGGSGSNDGHPYNITGIGVTAAGNVAMYANMYLLISSSQYRDARPAWVLAAATLGYDTNTVKSVWTACGILPQAKNLEPDLTAINFGNVGNGSSKQVILSLRNTGLGATTISSISSSNPMFSITATLPLTVAGGQTARLPVIFRPTSIGPQNGVITILSNADDNPTIEVSVSGIGVPPAAMSVSPGSLKQLLLAGDSTIRNMTIKNTAVTGSENLIFNIDIINQTSLAGTWQPALIPGDGSYKTPGWSIIEERLKPSVGLKSNPLGPVHPAASHVKILYATTIIATDGVDNFVTGLRSLSNVDSVKVLNCASATPNIVYLRGYDIVLVSSSYSWSNSTMMGDTLAAYVDAGGKVCLLNGAMCSGGGWTLAGRIMTPDYSPFNATTYGITTATSATFENHPITNGVSSITTGLYSYHSSMQGNGLSLGRYSNGYHIAAYNPEKPIVVFNVFPENSYWGGDFIRMMGNTFEYLSGSPWLSIAVKADTLSPGDSAVIPVKFNAKGMLGGSYSQALSITHNATNNSSPLSVPCTLVVDGVRRLSAIPTTLNFGNAWVGAKDTLLLTLKNAGNEATVVSSIASNHAEFLSDVRLPLTVPALDSIRVMVVFSPVSIGLKSGVLTITSDAEDNPVLQVTVAGQATSGPAITVSPNSFHESLQSGQTRNDSLSITNSGDDYLNFNITIEGTQNIFNMHMDKIVLQRHAQNMVSHVEENKNSRVLPGDTLFLNGNAVDAGSGKILNKNTIQKNIVTQRGTGWSPLAPMSIARAQHCVAVHPSGKIYVFGGYNSNSTELNSLEIYDIASNTWSSGTPMPVAERGMASAVDDSGYIYAFTAIQGNSYRYNPRTNSWEQIPPPPTTMIWEAAAVKGNDGRIYVFGGEGSGGSDPLNSVFIYNPLTRSWSSGSPMPTARYQLSAVVGPGGLIYVAGGRNTGTSALNVVEIYDPTTNTWSSGSPMQLGRNQFAMTICLDNKIYVSGGKNNYLNNQGPFYNTTEIFNPVTNMWETGTPLLTALGEMESVRYGNRIYLIGGTGGTFVNTNQYLNVQNLISVNPSSGLISSGQTLHVEVLFDATGIAGGTYLSRLNISHNAPGQSSIVVPCTLRVVGVKRLAAAPLSLAFGTTWIGNNKTLSLDLTNSGTDTTTIQSLVHTNADFTIQATAPLKIAPQTTRRINVVYAPLVQEADTGTIAIQSDAVDNPSINIQLTGTGIRGPSIAATPASFRRQLQPADSSVDSLTISNTGDDTLKYAISIAGSGVTPDSTVIARWTFDEGSGDTAHDVSGNGNHFKLLNGVRWVDGLRGKALEFDGIDDKGICASRPNQSGMPELTMEFIIWINQLPTGGKWGPVINKWGPGGAEDDSWAYDINRNSPFGGHGVVVGTSTCHVYSQRTLPIQRWVHLVFTWGGTKMYLYLDGQKTDSATVPNIGLIKNTNAELLLGHNTASEMFNGRIDDITIYKAALSPTIIAQRYNQLMKNWISFSPSQGSIVAGLSQKTRLTFKASGLFAGTYTSTLMIAHNAPGQDTVNVPCTLSISSLKRLTAQPASLNFGTVVVGRDSLLTLTLLNNGNDTTTVSNITSSNGLFTIVNTLPVKVAPFGTVPVQIRFRPTTVSTQTGVLTITSNAADNPAITVSVNGQGILGPQITVAPGYLKRQLSIGDSIADTLSISNPGDRNLTYSISVYPNSPYSWIRSVLGSGTVLPGQNTKAPVIINTRQVPSGLYIGRIEIANNVVGQTPKIVPCTLTVLSQKRLSITPLSVNFGTVLIGRDSLVSLTLQNTGNDTTTVTAINSSNSVFSHTSVLPVKVSPFSSRILQVRFRPTAAVSESGTLTLLGNASDNPAITVSLQGTGSLPAVMNINPLQFVESLRAGDTLTRVLNISNTGGSPLQFSILENATVQQDMTSVYGPEHFIALEKGAPDFRVGLEVPTGSGGPDSFGYRWKDSDDPSGPRYIWEDIKTTGRILTTVSNCDDCNEAVSLSFAFPFYGSSFSTLYVSSNGHLTFGSGSSSLSNYPLPSTSMPANLIAVFFKDLDTRTTGDIYFRDAGDRIIVQYDRVQYYGGGGEITCQAVLFRDGTIRLYYASITQTSTNYTTGIQNSTQNIGLNIAYNTTYIKNNLAIEIRKAPKWLSISPTTGTVNPGASLNAIAKFDARELMGGSYRGQFAITHNDPSKSVPFNVPCTLNVTGIKRLAASPAQINFGSVWIGAQKRATVTLTNSGSDTTTVQTISSTNSRFTHTAILPLRLGPQRTSLFEVIYSPTQIASDIGTMVIQSNAEDNPAISVSMSGNGTNPPQAELTPTSLVYNLTPRDAPADQTCVLRNIGGDVLSYRISITQVSSPTAGAGENPVIVIAPRIYENLIYSEENYTHPFAEGKLIVGLKEQKNQFANTAVLSQVGVEEVKELAIARDPKTKQLAYQGRKPLLLILKNKTKEDVLAAIKTLRTDENVAYAEPDYIVHALGIPNDPYFNQLYGMNNTGQSGGTVDADIDAPEAWDRHTGNKQILIGVIDTGIDYLHPDLVANMWRNPGEIPGNGVDDDGNGFVDDVYGYNFVGSNSSDPRDDHYHGTHCAGTIAGVGNNGVGVTGVMWNASLVAIKFLDSGGSGYTSDAIESVNYATAMHVRITSNSWGGGGFSQALMDAIAAGGLFIAAAGNSSSDNDVTPQYPATYPLDNIISVAATDRNDLKASFSCYGRTTVDLGAPGVDIYSCQPPNLYQNLSGTSMATPHVSGAAGLVWTYNTSLTALEVKQKLLASVDPLTSLNGLVLTGGRLNVQKALALAGPAWLTVSPMNSDSLVAGASRTFTARVTPAGLKAGAWIADVVYQTNEPVNPVHMVRVTANIGTCRSLTAEKDTLQFGRIYVGNTKEHKIALRNICNDTVTVSAVTYTSPVFRTVSTLPVKIEPNGTFEMRLAFAPAAQQLYNETMTIQSNADDNPAISVRLSGQGATPPAIALNPTSFSKRMRTNQNASDVLFITNTGGDNLTYSINASGTGGGGIVINEFSNEPDFIELWNRGADQNMSGWVLRWIDNTGTSGSLNFTSGYVFRHGKRIVLREYTGTPNDSTFYYGSNIGWIENSVVSVALVNNANSGVDFVRTTGSSDLPPNGTVWTGGGVSFALYDAARNKNNDTDGPSDWSSLSTPSEFRLNPGQDTSGLWPRWLAVSKTSGSIIPLSTDTVRLLFNTIAMTEGAYNASLFVSHNCNNHSSPWIVPITLTVSNIGFTVSSGIKQIGASTVLTAKGSYYSLQRVTVGNPVGGKIKGNQYQLKLE